MKITDLRRNNLRYILFRLQSADTGGNKLTAKEFHGLLTGWGFDVSKTKSRKFLADIKNHFSEQLYFTGWANFAADVMRKNEILGTNKSWDIGMVDGDGSIESQLVNVARMVNRPNKWFLFGTYYTEAVSTRGMSSDVTKGLDYFEKKKLTCTGDYPVLREVRIYPDSSGRNREFNYKSIYQKGLKNGTHH